MKRFFSFFCLVVFLFLLSGCEINLNNDKNNKSLSSSDVVDILKDYADKDCFTAYEKINYVSLDTNTLKTYEKVMNIDYKSNYMYSYIINSEKDKEIYSFENNVYIKNDSQNEICNDYKNICDAYSYLGISYLFKLTEFSIKENSAVFTISGNDVLEFHNLFLNMNIELGTNYEYNPSILIARVYFADDKIESIELDLSLIFGSFYKKLNKTITLSFEEFEKKELISNVINEEFLITTADDLQTFVIEMIYEFGDSIYIKSGEFDMLIDSGQYQDGPNVSAILDKYCIDDVLDVLIATHGHADHLGGFANGALSTINEINLIIDYGYADDNCYEYENIRKNYINGGTKYYSAYECVNQTNGASKTYKFSNDLSLEILNTQQYLKPGADIPKDGNENDYSVVCKLNFKDNSYLFTGDLSGDKFTQALKNENIQNITVYKAAHHGATTYNSNNQEFLNYINPEICVSSAAIINQDMPADHSYNNEIVYQHPRPAFVRWILNTPKIKSSKAYYFNGTMGTIHITDNGHDIPNVIGLGATRGYNDASKFKVTNEANKKFYDTYMYQNYYK